MVVFILILLLLAAIVGVLGTVLKIAFALVLAVILAVVVLGAFFWWAVKRQMKQVVGQTGPGGRTGVRRRANVHDAEGRIRDEPGESDQPPSLPGS